MRQRLVLSTVLVVALALVAFAVPLALATRGVLVDRALDALAGEVQQVGGFLDDARSCGEVQLRLTLLAQQTTVDTEVALLADGGRLVVARDGRREVVVGPEAVAAFDGSLGTAYRSGRLAAAVPLDSRACQTSLVLQADRDPAGVQAEVRRTWLGIGLLALVVLLLAIAGAVLLARRLARPLEALASSAATMGDGDLATTAPRSGLEEADQIAEALDATAKRLGRVLSRSATFAADASHQLRTPLTALRLQLDRLEASGAEAEAIAAAQAEADRLQATIDELEALTRADAEVAPIDLGDVVADRLAAWQAMAAERGRSVRFERETVPPVAVRGPAIGQAVQVLLDNALVHGEGEVVVRVRADRDGDQVRAVRIEVVDHGPGMPPGALEVTERLDRSGGRGLPLARSLVEAEGGRLGVSGSTAGGTVAGIVIPLRGIDATG